MRQQPLDQRPLSIRERLEPRHAPSTPDQPQLFVRHALAAGR
jgi:hypothetical protein